jgi:hypothetical protein
MGAAGSWFLRLLGQRRARGPGRDRSIVVPPCWEQDISTDKGLCTTPARAIALDDALMLDRPSPYCNGLGREVR